MQRRGGPRWLPVAGVVAGMVALALLFLIVNPTVDVSTPGRGADRDEALDVAITRLAHGEHPYRAKTYLGYPISPLPGALVLGAPFHGALGSVAPQNLFWLLVLYLLLRYASRRAGMALVLWASFALLAPEAIDELVQGGDFVTNAIYVAAASAALVWVCRVTSHGWTLAAAGAVWGLCLCSRPNYLCVGPLVAALILQRSGVRAAALTILPGAAVWGLLTGPLYLSDRAAFSPLRVESKLTAGTSPALAVAEILFLAAASFFLAWMVRPSTEAQLFVAGAAILALPVVMLSVNTLLASGSQHTWESDYFVPASVFALAGLAFTLRPGGAGSRRPPAPT